MRTLPYGERAVLVEVGDGDAVLALHAALTEDPPPGLVEVVPAAASVLAIFTDATVCRNARHRLADVALARPDSTPAPRGTDGTVTVEVRYDGADLEDVAARTGLSFDEVVARHTAADYRVAFCGFAPGFSYLIGLDPDLHVPRLATPRTRVPAGAVAIAGPHTAIYPRPSPGGWSLLGRTEHRVWDVERDPPTLLAPGTRVRFVAVGR